MDSDRNSNQFLGLESLPLMDHRTSYFLAAVFLLLLVIADASNASLRSRHRHLIDEPPTTKGILDSLTSQPGKDSPVASPPPPPKSDADPNPNPKPLDPNPDPNKSTKSTPVGQPIVAGDGKPEQKPIPDPELKPKEKPTPEPELKPKEKPTPEPDQKAKEKPTPDPEQKPKEKPTPEPEQKPKEKPTPEPEQKPKEKEKEKPKEDPNAKHSGNVPGSASPPPPPPLTGGGGKEKTPEVEKTKKNDNVPNAKEESCEGNQVIITTCRNADMVACVKSFDNVSTEAVILVQNVRDSKLVGNLIAEDTRELVIPEHKYKKIKLNMGKSNKIVLKSENGECVLQMDAFVSERNYFMHFPSYDKLVTRINGAYLLIVTVIIFGGMWACCLVRRRKQRTGGGVPYQELEMALPESASANDVVTAEGWDEGWDDDWDGDNAVKSPGGHLVGSISANGLTARSSNKDGWENNWDD